MAKVSDTILRRQLLSNFRMRFSPEVQQTKEAIVDSFVEYLMCDRTNEAAFTVTEIQNRLNTNLKVNISTKQIRESLERLTAKGNVQVTEENLEGVKQKGPKKIFYELSTLSRKRVDKSAQDSLDRFSDICKKLFEFSKEGWEAYTEPFFEFLALVFSRLAGDNYRMINGELSHDELTSSNDFSSALHHTKRKYKSIDLTLLESAAEKFFRSPDPVYAAIKWNMAQNYYALRIIGFEEQSSSLSAELFANSRFYLDTNVIISALEPNQSHHKAFISLFKACANLGIQMVVNRVTIEELDRLISHSRETLDKVIDQIPDETATKISSDFYEVYIEKTKESDSIDLDIVFENFQNAGDKLKDTFDIQTEENPWFAQMEHDDDINNFAGSIQDRYRKMRNRKKSDFAAKHDALLLHWIEKLREDDHPYTWFVTRDHTLPGCVPPNSNCESLAITLDALIQWMSPIVVTGNGDEIDIAVAYSEIISSRILPQEKIFTLEDFVIFHELEMACKALPPEDVEGCISYIKQKMPLLNPTDSVDREKLARGIAVYLADPSRKYKENVDKYEECISKLQDDIIGKTKASLKQEALLRAVITLSIFIVLEFVVCILAANWGDGDNAFQKIVNSWPFILIPITLCLILGWFLLGKSRIKALGWPMTKLFKTED